MISPLGRPNTIFTGFTDRPTLRHRPLLRHLIVAISLLMASSHGFAFQATHELTVTLAPETSRLSGTDHITLKDVPKTVVPIGLNPRIRITALTVNGVPRQTVAAANGVAIDLSNTAPGQAIDLEIRYEGYFRDKAPELPANTDNPGYGVSGTITPRGTLLLGGAGWYPAIGGATETLALQVHAPEGIRAVTTGRPVGFATYDGLSVSRWQIDPPAGRLALSAGRYVVTTSTAGDIPIATYFLSDDQRLAATYLNATANYIALYEKRFGPYPFPQFSVVENFFPTGYGFPSYTLIGGRVLRLPFIVKTSLGHEIAHCWWGNGVRIDASDGNWSEGLTSYVADYLYQEMLSKEAARAHRRQLLRNYATLVAPADEFPLRRFSHRFNPQTKAVGYDKSAMVFHMLRQAIGDQAFWDGLRHLYRTRLHQAANWKDLQGAFEHVHGSDLSWYFQQWLERPGGPSLAFEDLRVNVNAPGRYVVSGVLRQKPPLYRLQVPIELAGTSATAREILDVRGESTPFQIGIDGRPRRLEADPHAHVFRRLAPEEIPATINALRRKASLLVVIPTTAPTSAQRQTAHMLARALGRSEVRVIPEQSVDANVPEGQDIVVLGIPRHQNLQNAIQGPIALTPGGFELAGQTYSSGTNSFFGVWPHPRSDEKVVAVLAHGRESDHVTLARKIPHYGRYSYLVFAGTTNRVKGVWPATSSPLVRVWPEE